jgi:hypothetical protein
MPLPFQVTTLDSVPEAVRPLYVQRDGKFVLDADGAVPSAQLAEANGKLVEFRDNNVKLLKALGAETVDAGMQRAAAVAGIDTAKLEKLKAIDPEQHAALVAKVAALEKNGVNSPDDVSARVKAAIDAALGPVNQALESERRARTEAQQRADDALLRSTIGDAFLKAGGRADAMDFIVQQAKSTFRVADNAVRAVDNQFSADNPGQPLGIGEWLASKVKQYGFAFEASKGGGSASAGAGGGSTRPGVVQIANPTPQELGRLRHVPGKGLVNEAGQVVEIVRA